MKLTKIPCKYGDKIELEHFPLGSGGNGPAYWLTFIGKDGEIFSTEITGKGRKALRKALKKDQ